MRLGHQNADHGFNWETPLNEGLGIEPMNVVGNRWTAILTEDVMRIMNHVEGAQERGHLCSRTGRKSF